MLGSLADDIVAAEDGIAVGEEDGSGEVGIVSGGSRGPGEEAAAGEGPRECGVGAGVTGADGGVGLELEGCAQGVTGVDSEESTQCARAS